MKNRNKIVILLAAMVLGKASFACTGGEQSYNLIRGVPEIYVDITKNESVVDDFLNKTYGEDNWQIDDGTNYFEAEHITENVSSSPITIGSYSESSAGKFSEINIYVESRIMVLKSKRYISEYIPRYGNKISSSIFSFLDNAAAIDKLATFKLGNTSLPYIQTRINYFRYSSNLQQKVTVFAAFVPRNKASPVLIVKPTHEVKSFSCHGPIDIYVKGIWPEGLKSEYVEW